MINERQKIIRQFMAIKARFRAAGTLQIGGLWMQWRSDCKESSRKHLIDYLLMRENVLIVMKWEINFPSMDLES